MSEGQKMNQKRQEVVIAVGISLALFWLLNTAAQYFYFDELSTQIASTEKQLSSLKEQNQNLEVMKANLKKLEDNNDQLTSDYKELNKLIPEEQELPEILDYLYNSGISRGLKLSHFSQSQKISHVGALNQLPITVSVVGADDNIRRYISDFTRYKRILNVDSIQITRLNEPKVDEKIPDKFNAEIHFSAFLSDPKYTAKD